MVEHDFLTVLRDYWLAEWPPVGETAPAFWADDDGPPNEVDLSYLRAQMRSEGGVRKAIGRTKEEARGLILIEVFTPRSEGPGVGERLGGAVAQVWRDFRHARIQLDAPSVVGMTADGAFNRHLVTLGWRGDMRFVA